MHYSIHLTTSVAYVLNFSKVLPLPTVVDLHTSHSSRQCRRENLTFTNYDSPTKL